MSHEPISYLLLCVSLFLLFHVSQASLYTWLRMTLNFYPSCLHLAGGILGFKAYTTLSVYFMLGIKPKASCLQNAKHTLYQLCYICED